MKRTRKSRGSRTRSGSRRAAAAVKAAPKRRPPAGPRRAATTAHAFRGEAGPAPPSPRRAMPGATSPSRRALDFGWGAGRLSQAIARRMAEVDGVDIARSMVDLAGRHNRYGDRCRYRVNTAPDLRLFGDGAFDFVYSSIVLQHIPQE